MNKECQQQSGRLGSDGDVRAAQERKRIGQDLHDALGQLLTGISLLSHGVAQRLRKEGHDAAEDALHISSLSDHALQEARRLIHGLSERRMEHCCLTDRLRSLSEMTHTVFGIPCKLDLEQVVVCEQKQENLYYIAQEAVTNSVRHAHATTVQIKLRCADSFAALTIIDDGIGLKPSCGRDGIGLQSMQDRAEAIGGELALEKAPAGGLLVRCLFPVEAME